MAAPTWIPESQCPPRNTARQQCAQPDGTVLGQKDPRDGWLLELPAVDVGDVGEDARLKGTCRIVLPDRAMVRLGGIVSCMWIWGMGLARGVSSAVTLFTFRQVEILFCSRCWNSVALMTLHIGFCNG